MESAQLPLSNVSYPFPVGGNLLPVFVSKLGENWKIAAEQKGFQIIGRTLSRYMLIVVCKICRQPMLVAASVVRDFKPRCSHCIAERKAEAAAKVGGELLAKDPHGKRHYRLFRLDCGHTVRRQSHRVESSAAGGHGLRCPSCTEQRHETEADAFGWSLLGRACRKDQSYRRYRHSCGHEQDVAVANMRLGDVNCSGCSESWSAKPSSIYIFEFALPRLNVIKLGFSSNPKHRLRQVQLNPETTRGIVHRTIKVESGNRAICVEKALHSHLKSNKPDFIIDRTMFRNHLRTSSEIYDHSSLGYISSLLDRVETGWDPTRP